VMAGGRIDDRLLQRIEQKRGDRELWFHSDSHKQVDN
jgi:hypothetical protein